MKNKLKDPDYFIVGLQKSGTYWLAALLDSHPKVRCLPTHAKHNISKGKTGADEGRIFDMLASIDSDGGKAMKMSFSNHHGGFFKNIVPLIGKTSKQKLYSAVKKRYMEWFKFHNKENKPIVGDKTTEYIFNLDMIDDFYPKAKKICIIRDPRDRVVSWHYHQIRRGRKKTNQISDKFIKEYIKNQIAKEYESMLAYKGSICCITYEDLTLKPHETLKKVFKYLGINTTKNDLDKIIKEGSVESLRKKDTISDSLKKKTRGETVIKSHYRKGIVGDWRNHLSKEQNKMISKMISNTQNKVFKKYNP